MKQRLMAIIAALAVTFTCLTACGDSSSNEDASKTESSSAAETNTTSSESKPETTTATTAETTTTTTTTQATTTVPQNKNRVVLDVKNIQQKPELPRGSEITCATMLLNYYGFNVSKMDMLKYLPIVEAPDANGVWVSPLDAYVGNPKLETGYGCYNNIIKKAIRAYFKTEKITDYEVKDPVKTNFVDLYEEINKNNPVIIWASNDMTDIKFSEKGWKTASEDFYWPTNVHCLVLIGYDKDKGTAIFSDPLDPKGTVEYPEKDVAKVYDQMYSMALVIHKK